MRRAIVFALALGSATAAASPVAVNVIEVAGGVAYVTPGRAGGLVPGTKVTLRGQELTVLEATEKTASLRIDGAGVAVAVGDIGSANVDIATATAVKMLPKPRAESEFTGQWPAPSLPAETQHPDAVPLGSGRAPGRAHVTFVGHGYGTASSSGATGDAEGRVIASFDVMDDRPLAADLDFAGRAFTGGYDAQTHTPLFVRAAQLRYGSAADPMLAIGRLRFAASSLGMLDGGRVAMHRGSLELAAFGGVLPDPVSGKPDTSASRFGVEGVLDERTLPWQPRVALLAYGSTWHGKLDERRLSVVASANKGTTWIDGWAEAQQFASDNPWNAHTVELTGAGGSLDWRDHGAHAGANVTYLRPDRSLRLAASLPPDWLCTRVPQLGNVPEACGSGDYWVTANASGGLRHGGFAIDAVGTVGESHGVYSGYEASGYLRGEVAVTRDVRVVAGASAGHASFATWRAAELGFGAVLSRRLDAIVTYRPEQLGYVAGVGNGTIFSHSLVVDSHYALTRTMDIGGSALAITGADRDALAVLGTVIWRPLP